MVNYFIRAGDLRERISFKRETSDSENSFGEPVSSGLSEIQDARASVNYGKGSERRQAGIEGNDLSATFRVRTSAAIKTVTPGDVIEFDGVIWDITSSAPLGDVGYDFTATRRAST